jgi:AAA domain, putative AbiEii toxin, Type IV TA system
MRVATVRLVNFKCFVDTDEISLGQVNALVGRNNHGKSAFISAVNLLQQGSRQSGDYVRLGSQNSEVTFKIDDATGPLFDRIGATEIGAPTSAIVRLDTAGGLSFSIKNNITNSSTSSNTSPIPAIEPNNFIYTYLSKRKVTTFDPVVNLSKAQAVERDMRNLVSKVVRLANPDYEHYGEYTELCNSVLGFRITAYPTPDGQHAGIPVGSHGYIPIESMGEGVSSQLGLITDLCMASGHLFLIEEPENDIHPEGLKTLLNVIVEKSQANQFIVSTHSNIVTRYLGAAPDSKIFEFDSTYRRYEVPTSIIQAVAPTPEARIQVLRRLGYELTDFDLWDGWLILEESTAEIIIKYLIPWFVPNLARVRTVAAGGTSKVEPTFEDFRRLFLFAHLEVQYRGRAWVVVDGDDEGKKVVAGLRRDYKSWPADHFTTWTQPDFERYYPARFDGQVKALLAKRHDDKPAPKKALVDKVKAWCNANPEEAKGEFELSATEVIEKLREIDKALRG